MSDQSYTAAQSGAATQKSYTEALKNADPLSPPSGSGTERERGRASAAQMNAPARILQIVSGYQPLYVLATALDLKLFSAIAKGSVTRRALATATGSSERGLERLLDALAALELLTREGFGEEARYGLTPEAHSYLLEEQPSYLGGYVRFAAYRLSEQWRGLTECVRTGEPITSLDKPEEGTAFWDELVDLLFPWNYPLACIAGREVARGLSTTAPRLLDVAAGSGVWGIAAAQANPGLSVVAFDLQGVLSHARRNVERFRLGERFEFREGNIRQDSLGEAEFDAAVLGQICHSEGEVHSRRLFEKVARALKPGGTIVIADMLAAEDRSGPLFTLMYALTMLISTTDGNTFKLSEYDTWLRAAGFTNVRLLEAMGQTLLLATRI
jgi:ubiquinone/menaquinone biosynthesis C-methylase UbiE